MTIIACVDVRRGMAFNGRRQSRDSVVYKDIARIADGEKIGMDERSEMLFADTDARIVTGRRAEKQDIYFLEFASTCSCAPKADRIILYHWNRHYPADMHFEVPMDGFKFESAEDIIGTSHEKITREVYIREK